MKNLKFTGGDVHVGIHDFGFNWKRGDEHEVEDAVANLAVKTFPTLFVIVRPLTAAEKKAIEDVKKAEEEANKKALKDADNKKFEGDNK